MGLIKDIYSHEFYRHLAAVIKEAYPSFLEKDFVQQVMIPDFQAMEWKERLKHSTKTLGLFFPERYLEAVPVLLKVIEVLKSQGISGGLEHMIFPDYIETYGLDDFRPSVSAFEAITQFISCEFAVRPFIIKYGDAMIAEMIGWSRHENPHVRRLASEGSRPRLPWAMALPTLKKNPSAILPILERLKDDPSEMVRRSVANSLNDISKDHPNVLLDIAKKWKGQSKTTDAIVKHAARTLLKQGHPDVLSLYGLDLDGLELSDFQLHTPVVRINDALSFSFALHNNSIEGKKIRVEYGIYYKKANGTLTKKVFKISEKSLESGQQVTVQRKHDFRVITTRKYYPGAHRAAVIINGSELESLEFILDPHDE